ncbi:MAG: YabP/YqfC family sporulation protein [Clostridia bacterium]|nr:YabP/YqfC family sporulation protein [Clostridia bacterium]
MNRFAKAFRKWFPENVKTPFFVEIRGDRTLLCDGFDKITLYRNDAITLCSGEECIAIKGNGLHLRHLSLGRIAVDGRIDAIEFSKTG